MQTARRTKKRPKLSPSHIVTGALLLIPALAAAVFYIFRGRPAFSNAVANGFGIHARRALGAVCSLFPFSVMELLYAAAVIGVLYFIINTAVKLSHSEKKLRLLARRITALLCAVLWVLAGFCYLWGADYYADGFAEKSGLPTDGISKDELTVVTAYAAYMASSLSDLVPRDGSGVFSADTDEIIAAYDSIYAELLTEFPFLSGRVTEPKKMIFSRFMSRLGYTGIFFPFTGETNLNVDHPQCMLPFTVAHELAHQLGTAAEQECNFLGVAACVSSGNVIYEYSGWLSALLYCSNALYSADYDAWLYIYNTYSDGVRRDFDDNNAYWASFESPVSDAADAVYDGYLKAQGQELGIKSYGACVDLLVEYFLDDAVSALSAA